MDEKSQEKALVTALHTTARWYCISANPWLMPGSGAELYENPNDDDQEEGVSENASDAEGETQGDDIVRKRWRANFWHEEFITELLWEIERATPEAFQSVDDTHSFLVEAGRVAAETVWTRWNGPGYWVAWTKEWADDAENLRLLALERERFEAYLTEFLSGRRHTVGSLPYRRTLSDEEVDAIWEGLHARWPDWNLWFLTQSELGQYEHQPMEGVHRFWWWRFTENVPLHALRAVLQEAGVQRVWKLPYEHSYEIEVETFVPEGEEEQHYTSAGLDWVIYCDHESRMTVGGEIMIRLLNQVWPDWERYVDEDYTTHHACRRCGGRMRMTHGFEYYCPTCDT